MGKQLGAKVALAASALMVSACSTLMPQQTLVVTTPEPGADVYMALEGDTSLGVNSQAIMGRIPTGARETEFAFIGETPLTHTFYTTEYGHNVSSPGEFSANTSTVFRSATIAVVYDDGAREERRVRLNNGEIQLRFDGADSASAVASAPK